MAGSCDKSVDPCVVVQTAALLMKYRARRELQGRIAPQYNASNDPSAESAGSFAEARVLLALLDGHGQPGSDGEGPRTARTL
jgi:hypothetical protein